MTTTRGTKPVEQFGQPGDVGYRQATEAFNTAVVVDPAAALTAHHVADVRAAVVAAREAGRKLVTMTTGHGASMLTKDLADVDLIKTDLQAPTRFDESTGVLTFPAGATVQVLADEAARHGRSVLHGSTGGVGAVGFLLGGGMSFYGRRYGIAANSVESFHIVLADGEEHRVDADHDPELFWALRGGGGGFGVVTGGSMRTLPNSHVVTGLAAWPAEAADDIVAAWGEWTKRAPRAITTSLRLMMLPPGMGLPEALTHGQVLTLDGSVFPEDSDLDAASQIADELLAPLRKIAEPLQDTWHRGPQTDALVTHMDPPVPVPSVGDGFSITAFSDEMAQAWLTIGRDADHRISNCELRQLGGAFADPPASGGVYDRISVAFLAYNAQAVIDPSQATTYDRTVLDIRRAMQPWIGDTTPATFVEHPGEPDRDYPADLDARVRAVRDRVDPEGLFSADIRPMIASS